MIDGINFFDQPIKNDLKTCDNIRKIGTGQGDDYTVGCVLYYPCFRKYYKLIAMNLSKQQKLDPGPKAIQQINFTRNLTKAEGATMFFVVKEVKETVFDFLKEQLKHYDFISF